MTGICKFCGESKDLRIGGRWNCAEAETIIDEGLDMRDKGIGESDEPAKYAGDKLRLLIEKGWRRTTSYQRNQLKIK